MFFEIVIATRQEDRVRRYVSVSLVGVLAMAGILFAPTVASSTTVSSNLVAWTQVDNSPLGCTSACTNGPSGDYSDQSLAYDPATHQTILFGADGNATFNWTGLSWVQVGDSGDPGCTSICASSPSSREPFNMAYDATSHAIILFGGEGENDTWAWNGTTWAQVADSGDAGCSSRCTSSPPDNIGGSMAFDAGTNQMVLFGGGEANYDWNMNATWVLSYHGAGKYTWSQVDAETDLGCTDSCVNSPPTSNIASLAYDPLSKQLILFGGEHSAGVANGQNSTWDWTGTTWIQVADNNGNAAGCGESRPTLMPCPSSPPARIGAGLVYDPALGALVLFGGMDDYGNPEYNDTWTWNGSSWAQVDDGTDPGCTTTCVVSAGARDTYGIADDAMTNQLLVFGGAGDNDTWAAPAAPGRPSSPTRVSALTKGSELVVKWAAPEYSGATVVSKYEVKVTPGVHSCVTSAAGSCIFAGLSTAAHYNVAVHAINSLGVGPAAQLTHVKG
jgi:hypothetical protein